MALQITVVMKTSLMIYPKRSSPDMITGTISRYRHRHPPQDSPQTSSGLLTALLSRCPHRHLPQDSPQSSFPGLLRAFLSQTPCPGFTESPDGWDRKSSLEITQPNCNAGAGSLGAGGTGPCPDEFRMSPHRDTAHRPWAARSGHPPPQILPHVQVKLAFNLRLPRLVLSLGRAKNIIQQPALGSRLCGV